MPGGIASAPIINQPSIPGEIASAIGDFPQQQQQYQLRQAEIDATGIDNSSKKLAVLTKLISSNPGLATSPQMISAAQRAFQGLGMTAPVKNVNGVPSLDTDALYTFGPNSEFIASNLGMLLSFPPDQRGSLIQAATGQALPNDIEQKLQSLPQRMLSTPAELSSLYGTAQQVVASLSRPGTTVEGVTAIIKPINQVLQQNGMPGVDMTNLEGAGLFQTLINKAYAQGLQGKAAEEQAQADYKKIETELAPQKLAVDQQKADAATTNAAAHTTQANAYAQRTPAAIAKDYADADHAEAQTKEVIQRVATGGGSLKDLEANANNAQALVGRLEYDLNDPTSGLQSQITSYKAAHPEATVQTDPQLKELNDAAYETENRIKQARRAAITAQQAFQQGQAHLHKGSPTTGNPTPQEHSQHLTATSNGKPIHSDDGGKTWQEGP